MIFSLSYQINLEGHTGGFIFESENEVTAVIEANAWMDSRETELPEFFGLFLYYQISPYTIHRIDDKGHLTGGASFRLLEWSHDRAGVDRHTYRDWKVAEFSKERKANA